MERSNLPPELKSLVRVHWRRKQTDEISLQAIATRWSRWFEQMPELEEMSAEMLAAGREIIEIDEARRMRAVNAMKGQL